MNVSFLFIREDVPFIDYPIYVKILWKRDRTLRIDYKEKKLTIMEQNQPRLVISGKQLQRVCSLKISYDQAFKLILTDGTR